MAYSQTRFTTAIQSIFTGSDNEGECLAGSTGRAPGTSVLNLCFHGIGEPDRPLEPDEENFWITEAQFDGLLSVIERHSSVRITFDDGNASDASIALPGLRKRGLTATFFVIADRIDEQGSLSSSEVKRLVAEGMSVGSHGKTHRPWREVPDSELASELVDAAEIISAVSGAPVRELACPFGSYDRRVLRTIRHCGFERVYTVDGGPTRANAWLQPRYTIRLDDTPADIDRKCRLPRGSTAESVLRVGKTWIKRWR
jgi:peptidoglycan/xylan/chitin deacetylase (PgdA/CDA1 family)